MQKERSLKQRIVAAIMALVMLMTSLLGTTFAWFTDSVTSSGNVIQTGELDAQMHWSDELLDSDSDEWNNAEGATPVFNYNNWEPGYTEVRYIKVSNAGSLNFKWKLNIEANGAVTDLADVIDVYYVNPVNAELESLDGLTSAGKLSSVLANKTAASGNLAAGGNQIFAIAFHMDELAGNEYQNTALCDGGFSLKLIATQDIGESDSFGDDYDAEAQWPEGVVLGNTASAGVTADANNRLSADASMTSADGKISASVPAGALLAPGTNSLTLNVANMDTSGANITLADNEDTISIDVHILGIAEDNETVMAISVKELLPVGLNMGNYRFYHVEDGQTAEMTLLADGATPAHNNFEYDPATGDVVLYLKSFSEVALVAETEKAWEGNFDYSWYTNAVAPVDGEAVTEYVIANADQLAAFGAIVGGMDGQTQDSFKGKTVKLLADINLGDKESENNPDIIFYPIGYYNSEGTYERTNTAITSGLRIFEGTFDGNGHTVENFYHNTWEMKGDHDWYSPEEQYYRDGMGLFGRVYGGTIKNLTVRNFKSDGEIATTGVIAAYADFGATFENIAIFDCNPRVYNIGNGGIVGCVGWYTKGETDKKVTFKNITVDNSNKISALWGSYDVACGGIVGQYYPTSGQSSANYPVNAGIHFDNCHISAQMDVYNDVCANYQYYAYRYTGMLIGSVRENETIDGHSYPKMNGITAKDCTVHFGDWNDYYYCEIIDNTTASYTHDYQMSRLTQVASVDVANKTVTDLKGNTTAIPTSGRVNYVIVNGEHATENATCYHFKDGKVWNHEDGGTEVIDGVEVLKEDKQHLYLEFNNLVTGYGWGVTSKGLTDFKGVENMDITEGREESVEKFEGKVTELANNKAYTLGEIFTFVDKGVELVPGALAVSVTNVDENNPVSATIVYDRENWENGTITLTGTGKVTITIQDYYFCTPTTITVNVTDRQPEEKFDVVMNNGDFLHRVGNVGTVALGKLFKAKDGVNVGTVSVTVETITGASGTYTSNATWTNGTIQFNGTGVVKVTIKDDDKYCASTVLYLEVVDATNITSSKSPTNKSGISNSVADDVVLLNDISGGFTVSDGYTFYGNGFKVRCAGTGSYRSAAVSYGFITIEGGVLDNVKVICDIFPESYLYSSEMKAGSDGRYPYSYSAVIVSGDSKISNSYIYGARNNIHITEGNIVIENTVTECGSLSNIHIKSNESYTVTLKDVTTIQYTTKSTYDNSKNVMGFGILVGDNDSTSNPTIKLEGDLVQYNWVNKSHYDGSSAISNTYAKTAIQNALSVENYKHTIDGTLTINMGIVFLKDFETSIVSNDNRTNKKSVPYSLSSITMSGYTGKVYSISSNSGITSASGYKPETDGVLPYVPTTNGIITPSINHGGINGSSLTINSAYENNNGWVTTFKADLDNINGGNYTFKFSDLVVMKNGVNLEFTVKDSGGNTVDKNTIITLNQLMANSYTLVVTDNQLYNANGELTGKTVTHEMAFVLSATKTSIEPPKFTNAGTATAIRLVSKKGGDWRPAYTVLTGVTVTYWSASESKVKTVDLSTLYNSGTISANVWTYTCSDYTLTITGGQVHSDGSKITPVVSNNTLYFASTNKAFTTGTTSRDIILTYVFTDKNASTTWNRTEKVQYSSLSEHDYDSFKNGTLKDPSSGTSPCVTPDTLVTLADGTQKRIDEVTYNDQLLVWNHFTGKYDVAPAAIIFNHGYDNNTIIKLSFSDGTTVKVANLHQFYDIDLNRYVSIDADSVAQYVGHSFAKQSGDGFTTVTLDSYEISVEYEAAYGIISAFHYNIIVEGMLSTDFMLEDYDLFNYFELGEGMTFDEAQMQADIEKYGLYTYEDFADYLTYEQFVGFNVQYFKIAVGKGYYTYEGILDLIDTYLNV